MKFFYICVQSCGSTPRGLDQQGGAAEGGGVGGDGGPPSIQPIPHPPPPPASSAPPGVIIAPGDGGCAKVPPLDLSGKVKDK